MADSLTSISLPRLVLAAAGLALLSRMAYEQWQLRQGRRVRSWLTWPRRAPTDAETARRAALLRSLGWFAGAAALVLLLGLLGAPRWLEAVASVALVLTIARAFYCVLRL